MKLWELKAQCLRLMFSDTDIDFTENDFKEGIVYNNYNTKEKLSRMEDSIRRAIDFYYEYVGELPKRTTIKLDFDDNGDGTFTYYPTLTTSGIENFGFPTRISIIKNSSYGIPNVENMDFDYDMISKKITMIDDNVTLYEGDITFELEYRLARLNLPYTGIDELTYELNDLLIPEEIQRYIPYYVKGELYEEDEYSIAQNSKREYFNFLVLSQRRNFTKKRGKVKIKYPRSRG